MKLANRLDKIDEVIFEKENFKREMVEFFYMIYHITVPFVPEDKRESFKNEFQQEIIDELLTIFRGW